MTKIEGELRFKKGGDNTLLVLDVAMLALSAGVIYIAAKTFRAKWMETKAAGPAAVAELAETKK